MTPPNNLDTESFEVVARLFSMGVTCPIFNDVVHDIFQKKALEELNHAGSDEEEEAILAGAEYQGNYINHSGLVGQVWYLLREGWTKDQLLTLVVNRQNIEKLAAQQEQRP